MPKFPLVSATFEFFLRQAGAVGFQGCSKQGLGLAGLYLIIKYSWAFKVRNTGHTLWLQRNRNKIMHAYNGNVVIRLQWDQDQLIGRTVLSLDNMIDDTPQHQLSIPKLLQLRKHNTSEPLIQTRLVSQLPALQTTPPVDPPKKPHTRSGRRRKVVTAEGPKFYKQNKQVSSRAQGILELKELKEFKQPKLATHRLLEARRGPFWPTKSVPLQGKGYHSNLGEPLGAGHVDAFFAFGAGWR